MSHPVTGIFRDATRVVASPALAVFATGPLLAAIKGAVAGAAVGLEVGALAGLGVWKDVFAEAGATHVRG